MAHDVNSDDVEHVEPTTPQAWYVWRRGDSYVGISNVEPHEMFTEDYTYTVLMVTNDLTQAHYEAMIARSVN